MPLPQDSSFANRTMPPPAPLPLTLIVAATTRNLGIGRAGTLPWPSLKGEMGYFARVTKRAPTGKNAVVMGRKTWESIPPKFRPLKGRVNVVVSGSLKAEEMGKTEDGEELIVVRSFEEGLRLLAERRRTTREQDEQKNAQNSLINNIFIIGGATIYKAAMDVDSTFSPLSTSEAIPVHLNILLTRIHTDFECDTFFPLDPADTKGWLKRDRKDLEGFVGEDLGKEQRVKEKTKDGDEVEYEFCLWERQ